MNDFLSLIIVVGAYLLLCVLLGLLANHKGKGYFWGVFFISALVTPVLFFLVCMIYGAIGNDKQKRKDDDDGFPVFVPDSGGD